jgi:membrane protease subunit (stomatin/prohibitin family)
MGLLKAGVGAIGGVLADQWREYFYCEALDADTLVAKGEKRTGQRSSNTKGESNVISNGSIVAVADGQCMMIVENGAVIDVCAEPGEFVYDTGTEPSVFSGKLGDMVKKSFEQVGRRFTFGGDAGKDQRIYYFNTKEIVGNKYGTASPVPFRVVDEKIGLDVDITVRCNGEYSYKLVDPLMFYKNVCGNVESAYTRDLIDSQLKSELLTALQPAFARISEMGIRYSAVPAHTKELADALNEELSHEWRDRRGIEIAAFGVNTISAPEDQEQMIRDLQKAAVMANPAMAAANIASAQSDAMRTAAANPAGAAMGFMGMGMAGGMGGMNAAQLFGQAAQTQQQVPSQAQPVGGAAGVAAGAGASMAAGAAWTCSCGSQNSGKFCGNCGSPKPEAAGPWFCTNCGAQNAGNFCSACGNRRPQ